MKARLRRIVQPALERLGGDRAAEMLPDEAQDAVLPDHAPTLVEWGARLLSILLLLLLVGFVVWGAIQPDMPVGLAYEPMMAELRAQGTEWVLPIEVVNRGSHSILDLAFTVELVEGEAVVEGVDGAVPLLGEGEGARLEVWFSEDPRRYEIRFNTESYMAP